jgi:hypothetical protein
VEREQLEDLVKQCEAALVAKDKAETLLPTQSGFFFGSTDYDEWYFEDLKATVTTLKAILANKAFDDFEFSYRASW